MSSGKTMNIYSFEKGKLEVTVFSIHGKNNKPVFKNNDRSKPLKKKKKPQLLLSICVGTDKEYHSHKSGPT